VAVRLGGSPVVDDETQQSSPDEVAAPAAQQQPDPYPDSGKSTPEEIEAEWRNRISKSDKAHAAEARVLREQLAAAQAAKAPEGAQPSGDVKEMADLVKRLQQEVETERAGRAIDARKSKYPAASQALGDEVLAQMDEARLAALDASLDGDARTPRRVDLNNPARTRPAGSKSPDDMTIEELRAYLRTQPVPGER
jgi:hypothetical protein